MLNETSELRERIQLVNVHNVLRPESERLRVHVTDGNSGPGVKKPPLHVETFS